jgi:hypothetical protein
LVLRSSVDCCAKTRQTDALAGSQEASGEETELKSIIDLLEAYEAMRWPLGKEPGGKVGQQAIGWARSVSGIRAIRQPD